MLCFTSSHVFDSTMSKANKGLLLLMAFSTRVSLINRIFSLPFPGLNLRGLCVVTGSKQDYDVMFKWICIGMPIMNHLIIK